MYETSNLPRLRQGYESRTMLGAQSSASSLFSRSRRSSSSLLSFGSDLQSNGSSTRGNRTFKHISYQGERRFAPTLDVVRKYNTIQRGYKTSITALISEKSSIRISMEREKAHIDTLIQENEEREANIRETLAALRSSDKSNRAKSKPPSIEQLRRISNSIMKEGLKFKKASENQQRIDREIKGADKEDDTKKFDISNTFSDDTSLEKVMEIQRSKLSNLVFQLENAKMKLETTMSNRDMLNRVIFDHNTNKEALKLKMEALTEEGKQLERTFEEKLQQYAQILGEMMWKNEIVSSCNAIAKLPKNSI